MLANGLPFDDPVPDTSSRPAQEPVPPLGLLDSGTLIDAGFRRARAGTDYGLNQARYEGTIRNDLQDKLRAAGVEWRPYDPWLAQSARRLTARGGTPTAEQQRALDADNGFWQSVAAQRARDPNFANSYGDVTDAASLTRRALNDRARDEGAAQTVLDRATPAGHVVGFVGAIGAGVFDPLSYVPVGGAATEGVSLGRQVLGSALRMGAVNMGVTAATEPFTRLDAAQRGQDRTLGDTVTDIAAAGAFGAVLGGAFKVGEHALPAAGEAALAAAYPHLPESVRQRWMAAGTAEDRLLVQRVRTAIGEDRLTPDEKSAIDMIERQADVRESNPFVIGPAADQVHGSRLSAVMDALRDGKPLPDVTALPRTPLAAGISREAILSGLIGQESRFRTDAISPKGALGLMQVMPATARRVAAQLGLPFDQKRLLTDPEYNRQIGTAYYDQLMRQFDGNVTLALAAYNAGPGRLTGYHDSAGRWHEGWLKTIGDPRSGAISEAEWAARIPLRETRNYVPEVLRRAGAHVPEVPEVRPELLSETSAAAQAVAETPTEPGSLIEPGALPEPAAEPGFDPLPHVDALRAYVRERQGSLAPERVAAALGLEPDEARRVMGALASQPDSGLTMGRSGTLRRKPQRVGPIDALTFLGDRGGLADVEGHDLVRGRGLQRMIPGAGPLIRRNGGQTLDQAGEALWQAGYFGPPETTARPSTDQVLDYIEKAARSKRYVPEEVVAAQEAARARDESERRTREAIQQAWAEHFDGELQPQWMEHAVVRMGAGDDPQTALIDAIENDFSDMARSSAIETDNPDYDIPGFDDAPPVRPEEAGAGRADRGGPAGEPRDASEGGAASDAEARVHGEEAAELDGAALKHFDDPAGPGAQAQLDSLEHDLRMAAPDDVGSYRIGDGDPRSLADILRELDDEQKAVDALSACLKPGGAA